jgi:ligand-binding sensor domain-containing protein
MNINTGKVVRHYGQGETSALKSNFIYTIYGSSDGDILLGTTIGIYAYDKAKDVFAPLPNLPLYNWYTSIVKTAEGVIWTSTYGNGVHYLNSHTGESGNFRYNAKDKASIGSDRVNSIFEDRKKNLWFATENGLCKWNPRGGTSSVITQPMDFPAILS